MGSIFAALGVEGILKILRGLGILKDPEHELKVKQALIDAQAKFLDATSSPIYAIARFIVIFAAMWDIFANSGRSWALAAQNLAAQGMLGMVEVLPIVWLFVGPQSLDLLREMLASAKERRETRRNEPAQPVVVQPGLDDRDIRRGGRDDL